MQDFLSQALFEAQKALALDEVPIGAVVVLNDKIIGRGFNQKETLKQPTAHAEIMAIHDACSSVGDWRLNNAVLYCTLEPCVMCAGAILQARLKHVVYGAKDLRWGADGSVCDLFSSKLVNHVVETTYLPHPECDSILKRFFKQKRG